jgi:acetoin utilization deacetylase AcuC-like enzyme
MVGFVSSPRFVEHDTGPHHPERPDRIRAIYSALISSGLLEMEDPFPDFSIPTRFASANKRLTPIDPRPADERWLSLCHTPAHVERIKHICSLGGGFLDGGDTRVGANGHEIALLSLGAVLTACDAVMQSRVRRCFAAARPPGHHAEPDAAMGFCLYSNVAIAAKYLQQMHGVGKVSVVDFDVHHGNGTQACLEADATVQFISLHQHPATCYPGSGYEHERGVLAGEGFTINIPMNPGDGDDEYREAFESRVVPALDRFRPEVLLISAGFDAHREDPLAQMKLSDEAFEWMTRMLVNVADQHCGGRVISVLEGGYNLAALGRSVVRHVIGLE